MTVTSPPKPRVNCLPVGVPPIPKRRQRLVSDRIRGDQPEADRLFGLEKFRCGNSQSVASHKRLAAAGWNPQTDVGQPGQLGDGPI